MSIVKFNGQQREKILTLLKNWQNIYIEKKQIKTNRRKS